MSESKHTPGPWEATYDSRGETYMILPADVMAANARLIAAAPDLLEVCRTTLSLMETGNAGTSEYWAEREKLAKQLPDQLKAAIAKATGGS